MDMDMQCSRWLFSKVPFKTSLMQFDSHELEDVSARMFNSTLVYARIESSSMYFLFYLLLAVFCKHAKRRYDDNTKLI